MQNRGFAFKLEVSFVLYYYILYSISFYRHCMWVYDNKKCQKKLQVFSVFSCLFVGNFVFGPSASFKIAVGIKTWTENSSRTHSCHPFCVFNLTRAVLTRLSVHSHKQGSPLIMEILNTIKRIFVDSFYWNKKFFFNLNDPENTLDLILKPFSRKFFNKNQLSVIKVVQTLKGKKCNL